MHGVDWVFSIVLAVVFLVTGIVRAFRYEQARKFFPWAQDLPRGLVRVIGIVEILCALGLILPVATGIYPWLTPVAAICLALLLVSATTFHFMRHERDEASLAVLVLLITLVVVYSRLNLLPLG